MTNSIPTLPRRLAKYVYASELRMEQKGPLALIVFQEPLAGVRQNITSDLNLQHNCTYGDVWLLFIHCGIRLDKRELFYHRRV